MDVLKEITVLTLSTFSKTPRYIKLIYLFYKNLKYEYALRAIIATFLKLRNLKIVIEGFCTEI